MKNGSKNILFLQHSILPEDGGVPRVTDLISKELTRRGHQCFYLFYLTDNPDYSKRQKLKVSLNEPYEQFEDQVFQFVRKNNIDVFIAQHTILPHFLQLFESLKEAYPKSPILFFLHSNPDYWKIQNPTHIRLSDPGFYLHLAKNAVKAAVYPFHNPYKIRFRRVYNSVDQFVLLSNNYREQFISLYDIQDEGAKLLSIPNPLTFYPGQVEVNLSKKKNIVLIVSRLLEDHKQISLSLKVWKALQETIGNSWELFIVGQGPDEKAYKEFVKQHGLRNVHFLGKQKNVLQFYQQARIFMMSSIWEGLPMTILEAQQNGVVPVVCNNFSAARDMISDGRDGFIIENNDVTEFTGRMLTLMRDAHIRNKMAESCLETSKKYEIGRIADKWEALFQIKEVIEQ
ncbi:glycosyltransferase [Dyadobacter luticola]|uniref:Glycosyltransferase family 4 protein n=1 Tax=Dyadobacter luticola TaxID=1979387 RepID=A0A5R9L3T4_9BACT|nr:glycosyltransferase [Dyadobacter luticola]TLV03226.1 glycosyltransferase family 4 protein [Dyadobacter luticola]